MTRRVVYGVSLTSFAAATAMTIAAIVIPEWLTYRSTVPTANSPKHNYGLHRRCTTTSTHTTCHSFPTWSDCHSQTTTPHFCSLWRTVGFLMSFAVVFELATHVAFAVVLLGGKQKRVMGWKVLCSIISICAISQAGAVGMIAWMGDNEPRFINDWWVGKSWVLAIVAAGLQFLVVVGIVASRFLMEEEGGYELIPDRPY